MKLIIAGGRNYMLSNEDYQDLDRIPITEVVSGGAKGVDSCGEFYAENHGLRITKFKADWDKYGKSAGPVRNRQMAEYADGVALFPGGRGTELMFREANKAGIEIFDFRGNQVKPYESCETCFNNDAIFRESKKSCLIERDLSIKLNYPNSGKGKCDYYLRVPGSDDDKE